MGMAVSPVVQASLCIGLVVQSPFCYVMVLFLSCLGPVAQSLLCRGPVAQSPFSYVMIQSPSFYVMVLWSSLPPIFVLWPSHPSLM